MNKLVPKQPGCEIIFYRTEDGKSRIEVRLETESVWLTQAGMAELYQITPQNVTTHIKSIFQDGELDEPATCKESLQVQQEGSRRVSRTRNIDTSGYFTNFEKILDKVSIDTILNAKTIE